MICMVWPDETPPALTRSAAIFLAASSARFAVWVSALTFNSLWMALIIAVEAMLGAGVGGPLRYLGRSFKLTASVLIDPPRPSAASNSTFTLGPPAPIWI